MKKILILFMLIFLTGCSAEYNLNVSNNSFKENINVTIPNNMIPEKKESKTELGIERDDQVTPFLEAKTASLMSQNKFYRKKIKKIGDYTHVQMNYRYNENSFKEANSVNLCFEYADLDFSESYYINLQGTFYCLYADTVDIKIKTNNKVHFSNADEVVGNVYIWHVNESNKDFVDVKIDIAKGISFVSVFLVSTSILIILGLVYILFVFIKKRKSVNSI